jgi:hypothetical protein
VEPEQEPETQEPELFAETEPECIAITVPEPDPT